jgi:hypothetical protein
VQLRLCHFPTKKKCDTVRSDSPFFNMPSAIPELSDLGPKLEGDGLHSLREEVSKLLDRRTLAFPGTCSPSFRK